MWIASSHRSSSCWCQDADWTATAAPVLGQACWYADAPKQVGPAGAQAPAGAVALLIALFGIATHNAAQA